MSSGYDKFFKTARKNTATKKPGDKVDIKKLQKTSGQEDLKKTIIAAKRELQNRRRTKTRNQFPTGAGVALGVSLLGALYLGYDLERVEDWFSRIEVQVMGPAEAASSADKTSVKKAEKTPQTKDENAAKSTETADGEQKAAPTAITSMTSEEMALFKSLEERRKTLDAREQELKRMEEELQKQKEALDKRLVDIEAVRKSIANQLEEKVKVDQERVEQLVQFYSTMKPQQASKIIETLHEDLAVEVLMKMKKKSAAEIMNLIEPGKAQRLSEKFAGYRRK